MKKIKVFLCLSLLSFSLLAAASEKVPIVFHNSYDISFGPIHWLIEKLHPFDTKKYSRAFNYLTDLGLSQQQCYQPEKISDEALLQVHSKKYLASLNRSFTIASIAEVYPLALVPNWILQRVVLNPMRFATAGTVLGAQLALQHGWAINLSGGYHHAKSDNGGGFCIYGDIPLAIYEVRKENPDLQVLVIDLDAHQGNGHESMLKDDHKTAIFDVYNQFNYPYDTQAKKYITFNYPVNPNMVDAEYLALIREKLPQALDKQKPGFIIYNAGTDIFENDSLGQLSISADGIIERDELVFQLARERNIPILMVLSGGYSKESANIIGTSIVNVIKKFELIDPQLLQQKSDNSQLSKPAAWFKKIK